MAIEVTVRQLRAFITVVDRKSFSEAADTMCLSQAALSGLIKELESRLGVRLLDRSTRSVEVSAVGAAFEPLVRQVLGGLDHAIESVINLKDLRQGLVRVVAPEPLSCTLLPELMANYGERYPGVDVRFNDVPIEEVLKALANESADVGFGPAGVPLDDSLEVQILRLDPLWAALRSDDPLAETDSLSWRALRARPLFNYMPNLRTSVLSQVPVRCHPEEIIPVHRINTALSMLKVKRGYALCPSTTRPLVEGFDLAFRPIVRPVVNWRIAIFSRARKSLSPAVESFLEFTIQSMKESPSDGL
ncbi:LysR family transcriptional regulator [Alcaligenaceae bacterium]|nr:LysR family transcriptional regulator [Alcaligenaceae bacterium]